MFYILDRKSGSENVLVYFRLRFNFELIGSSKVISMAFNATQAPVRQTFLDQQPLRTMKRIKAFESLSLGVFPLHIYLFMPHHKYSKKQAKKKFVQKQMEYYASINSPLSLQQRKTQAEQMFRIKYRRFNYRLFIQRHVKVQSLKFPKVRSCYHVQSGINKWDWLMTEEEKDNLEYQVIQSVSQDDSLRQQDDYIFKPVKFKGQELEIFLQKRQRRRIEHPPLIHTLSKSKYENTEIIRPFQLDKYNQRAIAYRQRMAEQDYDNSEFESIESLKLIPFQRDVRFQETPTDKIGKVYKKKNNTLPQIMMMQLTQYPYFKPTKWVNESYVKGKTRVWPCYDCWTYIYNPLTHKCFPEIVLSSKQFKSKPGAIMIGYVRRNPFGYNIQTDQFLKGSLLLNSLKPPAPISPHSWICSVYDAEKIQIAPNLKVIPTYWIRSPYAVMGRKQQYHIMTAPSIIYRKLYPQLEAKQVPLICQHIPPFSPQILDATRPFFFNNSFFKGDILGSIGGDIISSSIPVSSLPIANTRYSVFPCSASTILNFCCQTTQDSEEANAQIILSVAKKDMKLFAMLKILKKVAPGEKFKILKA